MSHWRQGLTRNHRMINYVSVVLSWIWFQGPRNRYFLSLNPILTHFGYFWHLDFYVLQKHVWNMFPNWIKKKTLFYLRMDKVKRNDKIWLAYFNTGFRFNKIKHIKVHCGHYLVKESQRCFCCSRRTQPFLIYYYCTKEVTFTSHSLTCSANCP